MTVRRGPLLWLVVVLSAAAVAACQPEPGPPPMELQSGRWESDDGQWWVEFSGPPYVIEVYLPPRVDGHPFFGRVEGPYRATTEYQPDFKPEGVSQLFYAPEERRFAVLYLRDVGDWRVILDYPGSLDADPVELHFVEGS